MLEHAPLEAVYIYFDTATYDEIESDVKVMSLFIGPESDHWLCLSLTPSLTDSLLFSKLDEDCVGNSLLHTWEPRLGNKAKLLFRF